MSRSVENRRPSVRPELGIVTKLYVSCLAEECSTEIGLNNVAVRGQSITHGEERLREFLNHHLLYVGHKDYEVSRIVGGQRIVLQTIRRGLPT